MTIQDIKKLCPRAERITIYDDGSVSFRVGYFSRSENVGVITDQAKKESAIRSMYADLCHMNRQVEEQEQRAKDAHTQRAGN